MLANLQLNNEIIVSKILKGVLPSKEFQCLSKVLCSISMEPVAEDIDILRQNIQKKFVNFEGSLKEKKIQDFLSGKDTDAFMHFVALESECKVYAQIHQIAIKAESKIFMEELEQQMDSSEDFTSKSFALHSSGVKKEKLDLLEKDHQTLQMIQIQANQILKYWGVGKSVLKAPVFAGYTDHYREYVQDLIFNPDLVAFEGSIARVLGSALDSIIQAIPKSKLDPFKLDECQCLVHLLMNPESYYTQVKNNLIVSPDVAILYRHAYPEHFALYADKLLDSDLPEDFIQRNLGILSSQGDLVTICSTTLNQLGV